MELQDAVAHLTSLQATNDLKKATAFLRKERDDLLVVHAAVMSGWTDLVKSAYDIDEGDTVDEALDDGQKILHIAASSSPDMLRAVLRNGIDSGLFEFDDDKHNPAMIAAGNGNLQNLKMLVMAGADLDQVDPEFGHTALEKAFWQGNPEVLRYLLDAGADPTQVNTDDLDDSTLGEEGLAMLKEATGFREAMDVRRFKTIEVSMSAGEANFIMPHAIEEKGPLFVADVMGDLKHGAEEAHLEHGEEFFSDGPNGVQAAEMLGLPDVAKRLQERREEQAQVDIKPAPKGQKLH